MKINKLLKPGQYPDGGGLYFQISRSGSRSWIFRFTLSGRTREMGVGSLSVVSLAEARAEAARCRALLKEKIDPIEARNAARKMGQAASSRLFEVAAADYIKTHRPGWKNAKHIQQWENTLATYAGPVIGKMDVRDVGTDEVKRILTPIWISKRETASRVRGRIESILDAEKAQGRRSGENPARWRGHLSLILPNQKRKKKIKHHPALPWDEVPEFMMALAKRSGQAARMLELLILTAVRTQEIRFCRPDEFDMRRKVWTVPGDRMKMEMPLRVPLSDRALGLARDAIESQRYGWVFPGGRKGKPFSNMAMLAVLERMGYGHITVHGFRSTFAGWATESAGYADELADKALAHVVGDDTKQAYFRGDRLEKRRDLMQAWATYCYSQSVATVSL
ncbi:tyrosine-type recombinase/integrase [Castellaniella caeni]|uniref:tyrosine-type recombinase/integrase n=1 Tax=Castellaniella caeni TaxID=266123 RepID=UPI003570EDBA